MSANFAIGQVAMQTQNCNRECVTPFSLKEEMSYMIKILEDNDIRLSTPIAHIVAHDWNLEAGTDACKHSGGG